SVPRSVRRPVLRAAALALVVSLGASLPAFADTASFVRSLWADAERNGVSRQVFETAFAGYSPSSKLMELTRKQPEFSQTVQQYVEKRITDAQAAKGRVMRQEVAQTLGG